jgi:hypothetical protein
VPSIAGEAAVRIVPSLKGFHAEVTRKLEAKRVNFDVNVTAKTAAFEAEMKAVRAYQEARPVTLTVRTDFAGLRRDLSQVEHIFQRNALVKGMRLNVKIIGLDALPALAYAAGSAASGLDALGKSAFMLPAAFSAAGAAAAAFGIGISGIGDAFKAHNKDAKDAATRLNEVRSAQRELQSAQRDVTGAIRDQRRELEDLNAELRRASLDEADALLNLQESADRLKQGGFKTITEYQRAQLRYLRDIEGLKDVRKNNIRLLDDTNEANEKGIAQGDKVVSAIEKVSGAVDRLNQAQSKTDGFEAALSKLSPNAAKFVEAAVAMEGAWNDLRMTVSGNLFAGLDKSLQDVGARVLPGLKIGLSQVATGLNSNIKAAVDSMGTQKNATMWDRIFGNTQGGLENFKRGLDPLITSFSRLSDVGATFLPRLGDAFAKVFTKFDEWTAKIASDGTLANWIDQGLDSLTMLGNSAKNIGSIISSVGQAFNAASGTEGGFIGSLSRGTESLAKYLKGEGRRALTDYFLQARGLIQKVSKAFGDMRPLIGEIIDAARAFSAVLLPIVGGFAKMATVIERHTGLISNLFILYASYRTIRPIIDGLTGSWKNYTKVVGALGDFGPTSTHFTKTNKGLVDAKENFKQIASTTAFASTPIKNSAVALSAAGTAAAGLFAPSNNLTTAFSNFAGKASFATGKVGALRDGMRNVATFIGPALGAGVLGLALSMGILGLDKLGEAHDNAKDAARRQKEQLDLLKGSLDDVTGATGAASMKQIAATFQAFPMPVIGQRNVLNDVVDSGLATPDQLVQAALPQNQALAQDIDKRAIDAAAGKIAKSDAWNKYKDKWEAGGITPRDLALAAKGDVGALKRVGNVEREVFGKARADMNDVDRALIPRAGNVLPSIADVIISSGSYNEVAVAQSLAKARENISQGQSQIRQATQAAGGRGALTPAGLAEFGKFGASNNEVYLDGDIAKLLVTQDPGELDPSVGQATKMNDTQWQIELTSDATKNYIQRLASGGLVRGKGTGTSDSNLMLASAGEFVTRKAAVDHYGQSFFDRLNSMDLPKFDNGGVVPPPKIPWMDQAAAALGAAGYTPGNALFPQGPSVIGPTQAAMDGSALSVTGPGGDFTGAIPQAPPVLSQPTIPSAPKSPGVSMNSPDLPRRPVSTPSAVGAPGGAAYSYSLLNMAQKTGISPSVLSGMLGMRGAITPYAGLAPGTDIKYGQKGFPDWVYRTAQRFGLQASTYPGHQEGGGTNKGIDWSGPVDNMRAFAQYLTSTGIPGLEQTIFMDARDGAKFGVDPGDRVKDQSIEDYYRDDWATHTDHVHTRVSGSIPTPEELAMFGALPAGIDIGASTGSLLPGIMSASGLPSFSSGIGAGAQKPKKTGLQNLVDYWTNMEWLEPENVEKFLTGQAQNVGSSLMNIGMGFFSGATGLDFSSILGYGQQVGNFVMGTASGSGSDDEEINTDVTALNGMTNAEIDAYLSGTPSLGMTGGLDGLLGPDLSSLIGTSGMSDLLGGAAPSYNPGGGAEQWRPVVRRVLETYGSQFGITNLQAWEDAIVRQIASESNGDPGADNPNDSNGKGGKQHVSGLLQFLPETFAANNITGGDYLDPVAQIAAVLPYVANKYGMDENGAPKQIGRGVGYARGGKIKGSGGPRSDSNLVRVSRGEFIHNANAVSHYGPDFFARLNSMQVPKRALPGFAGGMWWNPIDTAPAAAPAPAPAPMPEPAPPPPAPPAPDGSVAPPPAAPTAGLAPSTGGAPGPGATAPAPDPGALPPVADALSGIGSMGGLLGGGGLAQPGAAGDAGADPRAVLGAAPTSQEHTLPAISAGIKGAASAIGGLIATAGQGAMMAGTMGAGAAAGGMGGMGGGGGGGQLAEAGAKIAGDVAVGAVNVISSLLVGTATNGSTASASGVPMLPQRQPVQSGVPAVPSGRVHNGDIYLTNMDEYRRTQERMDAQAQMPFIGKY